MPLCYTTRIVTVTELGHVSLFVRDLDASVRLRSEGAATAPSESSPHAEVAPAQPALEQRQHVHEMFCARRLIAS